MKKINILIIILFSLLFINTMAQTGFQGKYYFQKQEMVAGINFTGDGRFEFFFSYGASDRSATGTYSVEGNTIKLKSDKTAGEDFTIDKQHKEGKGFVIFCHAMNKNILPYMQCIVFNGEHKEYYSANNEGIIAIDIEHCDKIYMKNEIFPDIPTLIKDEKNDNNRFEVTLQPSVQQLSFKGIDFKIEDDNSLSCLPNYFMPVSDIKFHKQMEE